MTKDVFVANDYTIKAIGKGKMTVTTSEDKRVAFQDMLYIPDLAHTLLSVSSMNDNGIDVTFKASGKVLLSEDNGTVIAEGYRKDNLYCLSLKNHLDSSDMQATACMSTTNNNVSNMYSLWHKRMGHLSSKGLAKLSNVVDGIGEGELSTNSTPSICEVCIFG